MPLYELDLDSLSTADPEVALGFKKELQRLVADCEDRPAVKDDRVLKMELRLVPRAHAETGHFESVDTRVVLRGHTPDRKSKVINLGARIIPETNQLGLVFSSESPDNVDQLTFGDLQEDGHARQEFGEPPSEDEPDDV